MPFTLQVPDNYGYAAIVALGVIPVLSFVQGMNVGRFRKAAGVPYPNAYASIEQTKSNKAAYQFNCAQRAHGHLLENMTQTIALLLFSGLFYPTAAAATGAVWVLCRILFAYGYITSDHTSKGSGRYLGSGFWLAQGALWGMSISGALTLI